MADQFDIYFAGKLLPNVDETQARQRVGRMFKASDAMLDKLFSGNPVRIKKNVSMDKAVKYRVALREAGALIEIRPVQNATAGSLNGIPEPLPASTPPIPDSTPPAASIPEPTIARAPDSPDQPDGMAAPTSEVPQPAVPAGDFTLAAAGGIMDDTPPPPPIEFNIDGLSMGEANQGSLEEFAKPVEAPPLPDISTMDFGDNDKPLDPTPPAPPPAIDISKLGGLSDTGDLSEFQHAKPAAPPPDISGLSLVEDGDD